MKKTIIFLTLIVSVFLFTACASSPSGIYVDEIFEEENLEAIIQYHGRDEIIQFIAEYLYDNQIPFAETEDGESYSICQKCNELYVFWGINECTHQYCSACADVINSCDFCGEMGHDLDELVEFYVDKEPYRMCTRCTSNYFANIQPVKPCYYCIHCGELTDSNKYIHSWTDEVLCSKCIPLYSQCTSCGEYDTELRDNICGMCGNF